MQPTERRNEARVSAQATARHSTLMDEVGVAQGMQPITLEDDRAATGLIGRADKLTETSVQARCQSGARGVEGATARTLALVDILERSTFYDQETLATARALHDQRATPATHAAQRELRNAELDLADSHAILSRVVMGRQTPPVVDAAMSAALRHRVYNLFRVGLARSCDELARARDTIPTRPTVSNGEK